MSRLFFSWNKWKYDQWWEVKFVGEGIIDQGGGFRDSLAEISDELCPVDDSIPDILPYFIKTPNHKVMNTLCQKPRIGLRMLSRVEANVGHMTITVPLRYPIMGFSLSENIR